MINFFLGILTLYIIEGIILAIDDVFGKGAIWADDWIMVLFCWWIIGIYSIIELPIKFIKRGIKK